MGRSAEFLNGMWKMPHDDFTHYFAGTGENGVGTQGGAALKVDHPTSTQSSYNDDDYNYRNYHGGFPDPLNEETYGEKRWARQNNVGQGEQLPLFRQDEKPAVFDYGASTKESSHKIMDLSAVALDDMIKKFPQAKRVASSSLSNYSGPMANAAIDRGLLHGIEGKPEGEHWNPDDSNEIGFNWAHDHIQNIAAKAKSTLQHGGFNIEEINPEKASALKRSFMVMGRHNRAERQKSSSPRKPEFEPEVPKTSRTFNPVQLRLPGINLDSERVGDGTQPVPEHDPFKWHEGEI